MRKIIIGGVAAALFVACSGEDDIVTLDKKLLQAETIYDLGKCTDARKGEVVFVEDKDEDFLCYSGKWIPASEFDASSDADSFESSTSEKSSSSEKTSSSEESSSSEAPSSSSSDKATDSSAEGSSSSEAPLNSSSSSTPSSSSMDTKDTLVFADPRDHREYRLVKIGSQTWFAENLDYSGDEATGICLSGKQEYCDKYGKLYEWADAVKACPAGSHLPEMSEWQALLDFVGERSAVKLMSDTGWTYREGFHENAGTDDYGFGVLPGDFMTSPSTGKIPGIDAHIWTATDSAGQAYGIYFGQNLTEATPGLYAYEETAWKLSVRCLKD